MWFLWTSALGRTLRTLYIYHMVKTYKSANLQQIGYTKGSDKPPKRWKTMSTLSYKENNKPL